MESVGLSWTMMKTSILQRQDLYIQHSVARLLSWDTYRAMCPLYWYAFLRWLGMLSLREVDQSELQLETRS